MIEEHSVFTFSTVHALQAIPAISCFTAMLWVLQIFYAIGSSQGLQYVTWSPQTTVLILALVGTGACLATCLAIPRMQRLRYWRGSPVKPSRPQKDELAGSGETCCPT